MRFVLFVIVAMLTVSVVYAQSNGTALCTDTDGGGSGDDVFAKRGDVKYGITTQTDVCLTSEEGVSTNKSNWLKEYYCTGTPLQRQSKVIDCSREGFIGCENGACKSANVASSGTGSNGTVPKKVVPTNKCGDRIVAKDKGEECDPPNSICFGKTNKQYGQCDVSCKCRIAQSAEKAVATCGDGIKDENEACETDTDCPLNHVCSSCNCVKQLTQEEIEAMKNTNPTSAITPEEKKENGTVLADLAPKNFTESGTMKTTSGVANFFKSIFSWIGAIFS